jgi:hypothetical protein
MAPFRAIHGVSARHLVSSSTPVAVDTTRGFLPLVVSLSCRGCDSNVDICHELERRVSVVVGESRRVSGSSNGSVVRGFSVLAWAANN